ncbi:enoyl-CoA hydratase/isomerase family protein [Nocardioides marmoriginsengisoli]|uniref:Enoyl-CoA hydratase/isomerase family protein n=1 Tax=Nocardioides marmoriginsengisoli TaxID=661483 RepID=A0A3N0CHH5_9ACTN|nr:enoyl-CoA hydratase/isomerase family protein [Nocardioides marmoriginsengisoli]RNL62907.1 enoyl-CoA hydratase/isomerase family protein [Nocardioides marmoriginsengisoli]
MRVADIDDWELLSVTQEEHVVHVVLDNPSTRNAWSHRLNTEMDRLLEVATDDDSVRVVSVSANGPVFTSGADLKAVAAEYVTTGSFTPEARKRLPGLPRAWYFPKPLIAGVHGFVGPEGLHFLTYCDFVLAEEGTRFSYEHSRIGTGWPNGEPLAFHFPIRVFKKLLMMGGWFDAETAHSLHFVQRVLPTGKLRAELDRWACDLAQVPPEGMRAAKVGIHRQYEAMGVVDIEMTKERGSNGELTPEDALFFRTVHDKGIREALKTRDASFDTELGRI